MLYLCRCPGECQTPDVCRNVVGVVMGDSNGTGVAVHNALVVKLHKQQHVRHSQISHQASLHRYHALEAQGEWDHKVESAHICKGTPKPISFEHP